MTTNLLTSSWTRIADRLETMVSHDLIALAARFGVGGIFFYSGRTKVDGLLTVNDNAFTLFEEDFKLPILPADVAAYLATYAEHLLPVLLAVGLATRLSAIGLLAMTLVIQLFVYPAAWPTHLTWAAALLYLVGRGGGAFSLDRVLGLR